MRRGFTGGLIGGVAAAIFSLCCLIAYQSMQPEKSPEATSLEVPAGSEFNQSRDDNSIKKLTAISTATRAKIVNSDIIEPSQGVDIDRAVGSSATTPQADSVSVPSLKNSSTNNSKMSVQRPASLSEKPTFTLKNIQKPLSPRAEGAISVNSETAVPLPKEEISFQQNSNSVGLKQEFDVSSDPSGPSLEFSTRQSADFRTKTLNEKTSEIAVPIDNNVPQTQFSDLELQSTPKLPTANFSTIVSEDKPGFETMGLASNGSGIGRDNQNEVDFAKLRNTDTHQLFVDPDLSLAPKPQKPSAGFEPISLMPHAPTSKTYQSENSRLTSVYHRKKENTDEAVRTEDHSSGSVLSEPEAAKRNLIVQGEATKPKAVENDFSAATFGGNQSGQILKPEDGIDGGVTVIDALPSVTEMQIKIESSDLEGIDTPSLELEAPLGSTDKDIRQPEKSEVSNVGKSINNAVIVDEKFDNLRPIQAFSMPKVPQDGKPILAIVLIADDKNQIDSQALKDIPFPLTIAVSSNSPNSTETLSHYRALGFEVAVQVNSPSSLSALAVEQVLMSSIQAQNETVAVIEGIPGSFQKTRERSEQIAELLSASGHGLLVYEKGLNSIVQKAHKLAIPVGVIYRNLNQSGSDSRKVRGFLDGAAFRARQSGANSAVVVTARLRPETLGALLIWSMQARSKSVTLAPLSQALTLTAGS